MTRGTATKTNVFALYDNATGNELIGAVTVELPSFELQTTEYSGAGIAGAINVPALGVMSPQTCTVSCPIMYGDLTRYYAVGTTRTLELRSDMAVVDHDTHEVKSVQNRWILRGPISGASGGSTGQSATADSSITMQVYKAQHWINNEEQIEWDVLKRIHRVRGEDLLSVALQNIT